MVIQMQIKKNCVLHKGMKKVQDATQKRKVRESFTVTAHTSSKLNTAGTTQY
uniref:Uncharacterized protein n=1 Tax=Rhizophora mucronata TaxID=61149 RepID=A0A2P2QP06_RHIMU